MFETIYKTKIKNAPNYRGIFLVRVKRLELLWVSPLEPKSSASTSFAIPAKPTLIPSSLGWRHFVVAIPAKLTLFLIHRIISWIIIAVF